MVKFGKSKLKALNKLAKKQNASPATITNKILKKKQTIEKKVIFQKEVLIKEAVSDKSSLVRNVKANELINKLSNKTKKKDKIAKNVATLNEMKEKQRPVEKHKKRQKTQLQDTKLLLKLMSGKKM